MTATPARQPHPQPKEYIRPEVMAFAETMEDVLRKHDGKKTYWGDVSISFGYLFGRISDEMKEAGREYDLKHPDYHRVVMKLVDVANFCMMCYDKIHPADTRSRPHPAPEQLQISDIIEDLERSLKFYKDRATALQCWQSSMRDPERKIVCDILANGFTLTTKEEVDNAGAEDAKASREWVLDEPHINQYVERIRKASKAMNTECPLKNIISVSLLIAAEHYEKLREEESLRGAQEEQQAGEHR